MRHYALTLLLFACTAALAEEVPPAAATTAPAAALHEAQIETLQRQLADAEQQRSELENSMLERENAQMARLLQDNQKLKLQIREAQSRQPKSPLTEKQTWFLIGAAVSLLGVLIGALLRGRRQSRRQWIN